MYLRRLVCTNIRGFGEIDLDLCPMYGVSERDTPVATIDNLLGVEGGNGSASGPFPGWSVITGDNGSGKSTVLKSIAVALMGPDKTRSLIDNYDGWVSVGAESGSISLEVKPDAEIDKTRAGGAPYKTTFWAEVKVQRDEERRSSPWMLKSGDRFKQKKRGAETGPWQPATNGWLAIGYGPFRRLYGTSPNAAGLEADPLKARFATLFHEDATLKQAENWLQELDYVRLSSLDKARKEWAETQLDVVTRLLSADFLRNGMRFDRVDTDGVWLYDSEERRLRLSDMSEGYRAALAMLIDIVRHLFLSYADAAHYIVEREDGGVSITAPAVVLIDEIDAHLHPAWQREIGTWLTSHFPMIQFIVTTHSPLVCQSATGGRVFVLPAPGSDSRPRAVTAQEYERLVAGGADDVLASSAFGLPQTRSVRVVRAMQRHAELQQLALFDLESKEAEKEYQQLELFFEGRLTEKD